MNERRPFAFVRLTLNPALRVASTFLRRKNSRWPAFTAVAAVLGISFGVAAFLVVVTVFNSFEKELQKILLSANPNLIVYQYPQGIKNPRSYAEQLKQKIDEPISRISLFEYSEALASKEMRTATVVLRGIEGEASANGEDLRDVVEPKGALTTLNRPAARNGLPAIILGKGLALKLDAKVGQEISLITATFDGKQKSARMRVSGILSLGLAGYDERLALLNFDDAVTLFGKTGYARGIEIRFKDPKVALNVSRKLQNWTPFVLRPWQQIDQGLFQQLERDGTSIKLIVLIISLVAAFNILTTLSLNVADRAKQIALLRSLGASRGFILRVFMAMGACLGITGSLLGIGLGILVLKIFQGFELGELKTTYFLERIPVEYDATLMFKAFVVAVALSFASSLYPANRATRVSPLYGLKHGHLMDNAGASLRKLGITLLVVALLAAVIGYFAQA